MSRHPQSQSSCSQKSVSVSTGEVPVVSSLAEALSADGYAELRVLRGHICAVKQFNYTAALVVGIDPFGYERRYCYERRAQALAALDAWDGSGHPSGPWIKCKGAGIDLLNPIFC